MAKPNALQWMNGSVCCANIAKRPQVMATLPGRSPLTVESEYAADMLSSRSSARKTQILVQTLAGCTLASTPNAPNAATTIRTDVQPWYRENGRWTKMSSW